jgi:hypothetical protein
MKKTGGGALRSDEFPLKLVETCKKEENSGEKFISDTA